MRELIGLADSLRYSLKVTLGVPVICQIVRMDDGGRWSHDILQVNVDTDEDIRGDIQHLTLYVHLLPESHVLVIDSADGITYRVTATYLTMTLLGQLVALCLEGIRTLEQGLEKRIR